AKGFVDFIEGVFQFIREGRLRRMTRPVEALREEKEREGQMHSLDGGVTRRYCAEALLERYATPQAVTLTVEQPWGRALRVQGFELGSQPVVLSEFGGMAFSPEAPRGFKTSWGYSRAQDSEAFLTWYEGMMQQVHLLRGIAGFCYTQLTDTFQEKNGLLDEHRNPKADLARLRRATKGERKPTEEELEPDHPMGYSRHWKEEEPI
ncbi:MAG: hypothetical protein K6T35_14470, partial [Meiothermus silvanus]|nr:hypothetical protein [Allomeiothermus silvanus]